MPDEGQSALEISFPLACLLASLVYQAYIAIQSRCESLHWALEGVLSFPAVQIGLFSFTILSLYSFTHKV